MRAIVVAEHGGPEMLGPSRVPEPVPGPGELLIAVEAAGVNFRDIYERTGGYPSSPPFVPGVEGAGRVLAVGEGVTGVPVGELYASANLRGAYAERAVVRAAAAV